MHAELTDRDVETLENCLALLARAGVTLAQDVEPADVEDAVADELELFRAYPLTTVAGLDDPDGAPLLAGAVVSGAEVSAGAATAGGLAGADAIVEIVERFAGAAGAEATDVAVMPDPETGGATGSVRVRFGLWDVADINYSFDEGADPRDFELDIVAAALPSTRPLRPSPPRTAATSPSSSRPRPTRTRWTNSSRPSRPNSAHKESPPGDGLPEFSA
ncbi:hypothetical protein JKI95_10155 [Corynebacterium aquatimens]|uniref:hypothetical protein n=1 Tax=Corynebacterium aquatimens TaxID=1190508 RepID=UPI00254121E7|nr:hypothetical protein [Corynebacterium aquatimens]QYH19438.1 hypothetical protein JKI95_10155 [Corynebacterium aquatimens]